MSEIKVAVAQAAPVLFDCDATLSKACELIAQAGAQGAQLLLLPEAFVAAYPRGLSFGTVVGSRSELGRELWQRYFDSAIEVPSAATQRLADAARAAGVFVSVGVIERDSSTAPGTLYCTLLYFAANGQLLGKHRKLKPTAAERLIWGEGDGSTMPALRTSLGVVGGLICWENYMPLARMAMYAQGVEIYLAPTADSRAGWQATMQHIALEGRCFVLGCNQFVTKSMYPADLALREELDGFDEVMCRGGSVIVSPFGEILAGPLWDREGLLYAQLDTQDIVKAKLDFDVVGHYARPDVFHLQVDRSVKATVDLDARLTAASNLSQAAK